MESPAGPRRGEGRWLSLWIVTFLSLLSQLWLCHFFVFGEKVPVSMDVNPSNLWKLAYHFPPTGSFQVLNWLGIAYLPVPLTPFGLAAALVPIWWFFTCYAPVVASLALLAMAAFLRELELSRPAALFGGVVYAWQGDILSFVLPGHYAYMTAWPFLAVAAWAALRAERTRFWAYAVISGAACGLMVALPSNQDRGAICSLLIAALYLAPVLVARYRFTPLLDYKTHVWHFLLCVFTATLIAVAPLLSLFQSNIVGVKIGGEASRDLTYKLVTQYSLGPAETLTFLVPGLFGWHVNNPEGTYWGWIGETLDYPRPGSTRDLNLAISTTGTVATVLALVGIAVLLSRHGLGLRQTTDRQRFYGRVLLIAGLVALVLSWGWHTPFYRPLFALPLMDKWRNPLKWIEITTFALVVLSAYGAEHLMASLDATRPGAALIRQRVRWLLHGLLALLVLGFLASYPAAISLADRLQAENFEATEIAGIMGTLHTALFVAAAVMALLCLLLHALWRPEKLRAWKLENPWLEKIWQGLLQPGELPLTLALGLAALSMLQMGWVDTKFIEPISLQVLTDSNPLLDRLKRDGNTVRVSVAVEDPILQTLLQNQFAADGLSSIDISAASRIPDDLHTFFQTLADNKARVWFLGGVKNAVMPQGYIPELKDEPAISANIDHADGYTLQSTDSPDLPSHGLVVMKDYLAKATLVPAAEILATDEEILARLKDPKWNPRQTILLPAGSLPAPTSGAGANPDDSDSVELKNYTPTKIDVAVEATRNSYLLINDQFDPDWTAQVNGHRVPILRADYILRAVPVPAGASLVTMRYVAHYHLGPYRISAEAMGFFSDGSMLAAWVIAGLALRRRRLLEGRTPSRT